MTRTVITPPVPLCELRDRWPGEVLSVSLVLRDDGVRTGPFLLRGAVEFPGGSWGLTVADADGCRNVRLPAALAALGAVVHTDSEAER